MEKFYSMMLEGENLKTAQSLKAMLEELVLYRADRILDKKEGSPFQKVWLYQGKEGTAAVFDDLLWKKSQLVIDIYVEPEAYRFHFYDRDFKGQGKNPAKELLQKNEVLQRV